MHIVIIGGVARGARRRMIVCPGPALRGHLISWLEALGFCKLGEAEGFLDGGRAIAPGGRLPLNTHGGQLSAGRTQGYGFVREAMLQLRGEAANQVAGARVAVVSAGGGVPSGAMLLRRP